MILRVLVWLAVVSAGGVFADESQHPCPCIPRTLCPRVFGTSPVDEKVFGRMGPCTDPETVHCCGTSVSLQEEKSIHSIVETELNKEKQLMAIINNAIERMNEQFTVEDTQREDKSIGITHKNDLGCDKKQCREGSEKVNQTPKETNNFSIEKSQLESLNSSNFLLGTSKLSEVISGNGSVEKVFIVYAENPKKNSAYFGKENEPQIVLPSTEPFTEISKTGESTTEESENEPQESSIDPIEVEENSDKSLTETKSKLSRYQRKNQLNERKSNRLHKLFPRRRPPPHIQSKNSQDENDNHQGVDDVEIAESNLDEVRDTDTFDDQGAVEDYPDEEDVYDEPVTTIEEFPRQGTLPSVPATPQNETEQTNSRRLPLPPRHLNIQPTRTEENKQTGRNALDLLRRRSKGRNDQSVYKTNEEPMKITQNESMEEQTAMVMDEINVKVINDMMKTNFTGKSPLRLNPAFKSSRAPLKPLNNRVTSSLNRNNQEAKPTESSPQSQRHSQANQHVQQPQPKPETHSLHSLNHEQSPTSQGTGGLSEENKVHRFQLKPRPTLRSQNAKLPSKLSSPISMTQEQAFDTSRDPTNSQKPGRRQPFTRLRARPQLTQQSSSDKTLVPETMQNTEEQPKPTPSTPFLRKRLPTRERLRSRFEASNVSKNKQNEEQKDTPLLETQKSNFKTTLLRSGPTNEDLTPNLRDSVGSPVKSEEDLEGSGSDFDFEQFQSRGNGRFTAPRELETGFHPMHPMMESRELKVVGPLPGGFLDPATGLSEADDIGLELPQPNFQTQFRNEQNFNQNSRLNFQTQVNTEPNFSQNNRPLMLLPPVFRTAQPQVTTLRPQVTTKSQPLPQFSHTEFQPFLEQEENPEAQFNEERGDLKKIQKQFSTLKSEYDMLLNRYAETLSIYIGQYKKLSNSAPPAIR